ncbi:MAG: hypothetical protein ABSB32_17315 [Thermodesulfobacteriota bacterium]|jgi:hypothetical protein
MKKAIIFLALFFFGNIFSSSLYAQSTLAPQEKCAEGAKKLESDKLNHPILMVCLIRAFLLTIITLINLINPNFR